MLKRSCASKTSSYLVRACQLLGEGLNHGRANCPRHAEGAMHRPGGCTRHYQLTFAPPEKFKYYNECIIVLLLGSYTRFLCSTIK